jgi:UDP-glucose 4-epimerase
LARRLLAAGHEVLVLDDLSNGTLANVPQGATFLEGDIAATETWDQLKGQSFDTVCHLAAQSSGTLSFTDPVRDMRSHLPGTFLLLEECKARGVRRVVYASSTTTYGEPERLPVDETHPQRPQTYYALGKSCVERCLEFHAQLGLEHTILRMPNVYGPGQNLENRFQGMVSIYLAEMLAGRPVLVKGGSERFRDFIHVDDVVQAWMLALESPVAIGKTYNLGSGVASTVGEVLRCLKAAWGEPDYPVNFEGGTAGDQHGMRLDISRIQAELGFQPAYGLAEGIAHMVTEEKKRMQHEQ